MQRTISGSCDNKYIPLQITKSAIPSRTSSIKQTNDQNVSNLIRIKRVTLAGDLIVPFVMGFFFFVVSMQSLVGLSSWSMSTWKRHFCALLSSPFNYITFSLSDITVFWFNIYYIASCCSSINCVSLNEISLSNSPKRLSMSFRDIRILTKAILHAFSHLQEYESWYPE